MLLHHIAQPSSILGHLIYHINSTPTTFCQLSPSRAAPPPSAPTPTITPPSPATAPISSFPPLPPVHHHPAVASQLRRQLAQHDEPPRSRGDFPFSAHEPRRQTINQLKLTGNSCFENFLPHASICVSPPTTTASGKLFVLPVSANWLPVSCRIRFGCHYSSCPCLSPKCE